MTQCRHAGQPDPICPISKSTCPGMCIYSDIMETINIGIGVCNTENKTIVFRNRLFLEIFSGSIVPDDYDAFSALLMPEAGGRTADQYPNAAEHIHINDRILGFSVYRAAEKFVWIFVRDITDKQRLESIAEAVNASTNIGYIFSGVRHEIGNPINSMKVALSVLKDNLDEYPREMVLKYINRTLDDIGRVEYLLQTLKNFNIYETQKIVNFDLFAFMERFLALSRDDFRQNGIDLSCENNSGAAWVRGDARALQQVLLNIMTNSADALEGRDDASIHVSISSSAHTVEITVMDNGCGIPEEQQKELFKPFFTSKAKGTGLGLVISRKMLAHMGGVIAVESCANLGTTVRIVLPAGDSHG